MIADLSKRLRKRFGRGFSEANLRSMRQFFLTYRDGSSVPEALGGPSKRLITPGDSSDLEIRLALPSESSPGHLFPPSLGWTHYAVLMRVADPRARAFYKIEAFERHGQRASSNGRSRRFSSNGAR